MNRKQVMIVFAVMAAIVLFPTPRFEHPIVLDCNRTLAAGQSIQLDQTDYLGNGWKIDVDITSKGNVTVLVVVTEIGYSQNKTKWFYNRTGESHGLTLSYGELTINNFHVTITNPSPLTTIVMNGSVWTFRKTKYTTLLPWWMQ